MAVEIHHKIGTVHQVDFISEVSAWTLELSLLARRRLRCGVLYRDFGRGGELIFTLVRQPLRQANTTMREEQNRFLCLVGQPPARLNVEQTAWFLNCQTHDVPVLVAARILKPLGNPPPNGTKYFATVEILELAKDRSWLAKMTNTVCQHWQRKNARKHEARFPSDNATSTPLEFMAAHSGK